MNGCIYRTKYNECKDPNRSMEYGPMCRFDCENKHPSNADLIRAMTDEELARFINFHTDCENCPAVRVCEDNYALSSDVCMAGIRKWLKQEVTE